jgi:hypothetical protein
MLIWHIYYNQAIWENNSPNANTPQRVYLERADGIQNRYSETGDPFPGTTGKATYLPTLWNETNLNKPLLYIEEKNEIIRFNFIDDNYINNLTSTNNNIINMWSDNMLLYISGIEEKTQLELLQIDGKIIEEKILTDSYNETYIPNAGLYIARLKSKNNSVSYKIIIK